MPITLQASVQARHSLAGIAVATSKVSNAAWTEACIARRVGFANAIFHKMLPSS
ncbi:hypothetical protein [Sulfurovum riftiae]|uniref:hypothetical protein n=1 Tax=Sulfurovum riftiae TaxID=1630136 RepID=UPI00137B911A|nr:hypothetical protein [Sulfurovum riftiae]